jgi:hypothetical protein
MVIIASQDYISGTEVYDDSLIGKCGVLGNAVT